MDHGWMDWLDGSSRFLLGFLSLSLSLLSLSSTMHALGEKAMDSVLSWLPLQW